MKYFLITFDTDMNNITELHEHIVHLNYKLTSDKIRRTECFLRKKLKLQKMIILSCKEIKGDNNAD